VTRATTAIALHRFTQQHHGQSGFWPPIRPIALSTGGPAMPQAFPHETKQNKITKETRHFHRSITKQRKSRKQLRAKGDQTWGSMVSSCGVSSAVLRRSVRCLTRTGHSGSFALWAALQVVHLKGGWIQAPPARQVEIG
jgi:hypothetical protein